VTSSENKIKLIRSLTEVIVFVRKIRKRERGGRERKRKREIEGRER
jgi:hypothetical protein